MRACRKLHSEVEHAGSMAFLVRSVVAEVRRTCGAQNSESAFGTETSLEAPQLPEAGSMHSYRGKEALLPPGSGCGSRTAVHGAPGGTHSTAHYVRSGATPGANNQLHADTGRQSHCRTRDFQAGANAPTVAGSNPHASRVLHDALEDQQDGTCMGLQQPAASVATQQAMKNSLQLLSEDVDLNDIDFS